VQPHHFFCWANLQVFVSPFTFPIHSNHPLWPLLFLLADPPFRNAVPPPPPNKISPDLENNSKPPCGLHFPTLILIPPPSLVFCPRSQPLLVLFPPIFVFVVYWSSNELCFCSLWIFVCAALNFACLCSSLPLPLWLLPELQQPLSRGQVPSCE